jgi:hypothetical protein
LTETKDGKDGPSDLDNKSKIDKIESKEHDNKEK